jgi:peptide/nickel transport system permease protein
VVAATLLTGVALMAILAPLLARQDLGLVDLSRTLLPPAWAGGGSWAHPLGTDQLGRDILGRVAYGARISLVVAMASALMACLFGTLVGLLSGYFEGWIDVIAARVIEAQLSLPVILVALAIVIAVGPSLQTVILAIAISSWVPYARVVRSEVLVLKRSDFVALSVVTGLRSATILRRHILPNVLPSVIILASLNFSHAIIYESSLSYLALGVQPPLVSWGQMIAQSRIYLASAPWLVLAPALTLAVTALSANILGDALRDRLDPRLNTVQ